MGSTLERILLQAAHLVIAACVLAAAQNSTEQIGAITQSLRSGQFDTALQLLQPALKQNPSNAQLWTLDGIALSGRGEKKNAAAAFRRALEISPQYLPALEGAAQIEYESGDQDAATLLHRVLVLRPHDPTTHAMLAVLAYHEGDCTAAVSHFEQSGSLVDSQPTALQAYGYCLVRLRQTDKAIDVYTRALAESQDDAAVRYRLASVQMMAQRPKDVIATLQPLLEGNTTDPKVLSLASFAYEADRNTPEAVKLLRQAILADPHDVNLYVDFATISMDHQSYQVGIDMINAGLKAEPKAAPLYVARGVLYVQLAQYDNAEADFEKADALDPRQSLGSAAEGLEAVQQNDPDQALRTVKAKLAKQPKDAYLLYLKAEIISQKGPDPGTPDFREAIDSAKKAVSLRPSLGAARDILAKLYLEAGENQLSIVQSRRALGLDAKDQTALYHLIQALRKSGQRSEIPDLLKRLADLRAQAAKDEAEHNRYKLVEQRSASTEKPQF